jgi:uncharacterized coiled-coil protein SlyX
MWQFQWALSLIPDSMLYWIYWVILVSGAVLYLASKFLKYPPFKWMPMVGQYPLLAEWLGVILMVGGVFLYGGYATEVSWRDRVHKLEEKIAVAERESEELNKQLSDTRKQKQKVRVEYYNTVKTEIKEVEKQINADCRLDPKVNELINKAAKNPEGAK